VEDSANIFWIAGVVGSADDMAVPVEESQLTSDRAASAGGSAQMNVPRLQKSERTLVERKEGGVALATKRVTLPLLAGEDIAQDCGWKTPGSDTKGQLLLNCPHPLTRTGSRLHTQ
jgi:hypothetical protein